MTSRSTSSPSLPAGSAPVAADARPPGAPFDGAVDGVGGHVALTGFLHRQSEAEVGGGVATALLRRHRDLTRHLGEDRALASVGGRLLVLDRRPLRVSGHGSSLSVSCRPPRVDGRSDQLRVTRMYRRLPTCQTSPSAGAESTSAFSTRASLSLT